MKELRWMVGASVVSWLASAVVLDAQARMAVLAGMIAPLTAVSGSWVAAERTYRRRPERLTAVMVAGFAAKVVFFGTYVAIALTALSLRPVPFVASFTTYFIALYLAEAIWLRRLFGGWKREKPAADR